MNGERKPDGGTMVFVMGLLGLLVCQILGIVAWIQGNSYLAQCKAMNVEPDGLAVAGRIMGMIACALMILGLLAGGLIVVLTSLGGAAAQM